MSEFDIEVTLRFNVKGVDRDEAIEQVATEIDKIDHENLFDEDWMVDEVLLIKED